MKFQSPRYEQYLNALEKLGHFAKDKDKQIIHLAVRNIKEWILPYRAHENQSN